MHERAAGRYYHMQATDGTLIAIILCLFVFFLDLSTHSTRCYTSVLVYHKQSKIQTSQSIFF